MTTPAARSGDLSVLARLKAAASLPVDPGAAVAFIGGLLALCVYPFAVSRPIEFKDRFFEAGTVLFHQIPRLTALTYQMPVGSVLSVVLSHWVRPETGAFLALLTALLLVFLLGTLLDSPPAGLLGAAVLIAMALARPTAAIDNPLGRPDDALCFSLFALLAVCCLVWRSRAPTTARSLALAAALGACIAYRSVLLLFPPLLCLAQRRSRRRDLLILGVVPYLFIAPWTSFHHFLQSRWLFTEGGALTENIITGACGMLNCPRGALPELAVRAGLSFDSGAKAALTFAAEQSMSHPLRTLAAIASRLRAVFGFHPIISALTLIAAALYRKEKAFQALSLFLAYYLLLHCVMCIENYYFYALWLIAAPAACVPLCRALSLKERLGLPAAAQERLERRLLAGALILALGCCGLTWGAMGVFAAAVSKTHKSPEDEPAALDRGLSWDPGNAWLLTERARLRLLSSDENGAIQDAFAALKTEPDARHELDLYWALARAGYSRPLSRFRVDRDDMYYRQLEIRILYYNALLDFSKGADPSGLRWLDKAEEQNWGEESTRDFLKQLPWALRGSSPGRRSALLKSFSRLGELGRDLARMDEGKALLTPPDRAR